MSSSVRVTRDFFRDATLVESPAMVTTLPSTNSQVTPRDAVARSTTNATQIIQGNWSGNGRQVDSFMLFRHNAHGGNVRLQLYSDSNYVNQVYDSGTVSIFTLTQLGSVTWGYGTPLGFGVDDQLGGESPYYLYFTATVCGSFKMTFTGCQAGYWQFGRIILGKYRALPDDPDRGAVTVGWADNRILARGRAGSSRMRAGERWREVSANMYFFLDADRAIWRDWMAQIQNEDFVFAMRVGAGGREERDHVFNVQLKQHAPFSWGDASHDSTITLTEV